jgi:hypothetical protein
MVRDLVFGPYLWVKQRRIVNTKGPTMNTQPQFKTPTQAEVQKIIHRAHRMRSEYFAKLIKAGLFNLQGVFGHKNLVAKATA